MSSSRRVSPRVPAVESPTSPALASVGAAQRHRRRLPRHHRPLRLPHAHRRSPARVMAVRSRPGCFVHRVSWAMLDSAAVAACAASAALRPVCLSSRHRCVTAAETLLRRGQGVVGGARRSSGAPPNCASPKPHCSAPGHAVHWQHRLPASAPRPMLPAMVGWPAAGQQTPCSHRTVRRRFKHRLRPGSRRDAGHVKGGLTALSQTPSTRVDGSCLRTAVAVRRKDTAAQEVTDRVGAVSGGGVA